MIELYGMGSPNVVKIYIALEELGLPYTVHPVDVFTGKQFDPAFLKLNPMAKVPVITDSDGPGGKPCTLFESGAILLYLAEKTGKLLPKDMAAKYEAIEWMMVQMTTLGPMFGQHVHFVRFAPTGNDYSQEPLRHPGAPRVRGDRPASRRDSRGSAAPNTASPTSPPIRGRATFRCCSAPTAAEKYQNVMRWVGVINERPAVKRALAAVDDVRGEDDAVRQGAARRRSTRCSAAASTPPPDRCALFRHLPRTGGNPGAATRSMQPWASRSARE